ncbi:hypothetical protein GH733_003413 [Mirounga leonina]|nr:hypothetical protein GH733_003413 [Mirounga leonina]
MSEIYSIGPTGCSGLTALSFPTECHCHTEGPLVPFVTLAHARQALLVTAVPTASLAGGVSLSASPAPALDTLSCASHSQGSARLGREPPQAGTVRGAWMAILETPPWAQASSADLAPVLGTLALASIMGFPAMWTVRVDVSYTSVHLAMQVHEANLCQGHLYVELQAGHISWRSCCSREGGADGRSYRPGICKPGRLSGCIRGTHRPQGYRKAPETTHPYLDPFRAPAATAVPLATLGTLGQGETPEGARAGSVSATIISVPVILLPATPTVGTANTVCTTPKVPAVPTAGLASMAVPCVQGAARVSVWLGWVRTPQGGWVRSLSSDPSSSPGCSCDPRALSLHGVPLGLKPASATRSVGCALAAPTHWGRTVAAVPLSSGTWGDCEPCNCHAQHTVQPACHPGSEATLHIACGSVRV